VLINGCRTKSAGERRVYLSKGLVCGCGYRYVVTVRAVRDGKSVEKTDAIVLHAGESRSMTLDLSNQNADQPAETSSP